MKHLLLSALACLALACSSPKPTPENQASPQEAADVAEAAFDSTLAAAYGADDYGMRSYVMAFLKKGPNRDLDSATSANLQRAHLDNIRRMAREGQLVLAGPFLDDGDIRGIYLFATESIDSARIWTSSDPAIQSGSLRMEMHPWYGTAGMMSLPDLGKRLKKISF